ncbi:ammonium transporter [Candidatus Binatia bacterium]|jgi:Amt family ammonium transporter|nr:ammonium transporter [Candidatus Binatia bacterium]
MDSSRARRLALGAAAAYAAVAVPAAAWAEEAAAPPVIDSGDTAWVLASAALVLMMTLPGLALFYGGLVRAKNVLNVFMQCFISAGVVGVLWVVCGYSLAFGTGNAFIGDFSKVMLNGVTLDSVVANFATPPRNIPELVFVMFQGMFAIITPALILGAIAERMKFSAWLAFITIWILAVYCPIAHMVWGSEGWIFKSGAIDFAGGLVVHMSSGFSAILAAVMLGKRRGFGKEPMPPHSLPLCMIGAGLLWMGWFGFNAGSALSASPLAGLAFLNTSTAASMAVMVWAAIEWLHRGKPTALGGATAAVAGLVAITPACGAVSPAGALAVGFGVAVISYAACTFLKPALGYDDSLDVFGVHALGGAWGALASGIFAVTLGSGIESNAQQVMVQLEGIAFTAVFSPAVTFVILSVLKLFFGDLRVSEEDEVEGLDLSQHSESAYGFASGSSFLPELGHAVHGHATSHATSAAAVRAS